MNSLRLALVPTLLAAVLGASIGARAASAPALLTSSDFAPKVFGPADTYGFEFHTYERFRVDQLGVFDSGQDGLAESHPVGLWDANGTLLASATVQAGTASPLLFVYRYAAIGPVLLKNDADYFVGAFYPDFVDSIAPNNGTGTVDPRISYTDAEFGNAVGADMGLVVPSAQGPRFDDANFTITPVPEPAAWATMLVGLGLAGTALRRRRHALA